MDAYGKDRVALVASPGVECLSVSADQHFSDSVVDGRGHVRLDEKAGGHFVAVAVPDLAFFAIECLEGGRRDEVLDAE